MSRSSALGSNRIFCPFNNLVCKTNNMIDFR
nr:MAG TPA: hypothetical protein [Caudoviricetes sp.]